MKEIILDEAYRTINVRDGDRTITVPIAQAVMRALGVKAVKGDHRSQRLFSELLASVESSRKILHDQWLDTAITYKVEWEKELRRRNSQPLVHATPAAGKTRVICLVVVLLIVTIGIAVGIAVPLSSRTSSSSTTTTPSARPCARAPTRPTCRSSTCAATR